MIIKKFVFSISLKSNHSVRRSEAIEEEVEIKFTDEEYANEQVRKQVIEEEYNNWLNKNAHLEWWEEDEE